MRNTESLKPLFVKTAMAYLLFTLPARAEESVDSRLPLFLETRELRTSLIGLESTTRNCRLPSPGGQLRARLEVAGECPLRIRAGVEVETFPDRRLMGNVYFDQTFSIPGTVAAFDTKKSFEGHLLLPSLKELPFPEHQTYSSFDPPVYLGRTMELRPGAMKAVDEHFIAYLPPGEHSLQLSYSVRVRDDSREAREAVREKSGNLDALYCQSEPLQITIKENAEDSRCAASEKKSAESDCPIHCELLILSPPPWKIRDSLTFELVLENTDSKTHTLYGASPWSLQATMPLICEKSNEFPEFEWDLSGQINNPFTRYTSVRLGPLNFQRYRLLPNCFAAWRFTIKDWRVPGNFSMQVKYSKRGLVALDPTLKVDESDKLPLLKSNVLKFKVAE